MSRKIKWSLREKDFIRDNAAKMTDLELSKELSKVTGQLFTMKAVRLQRQKMGLNKKSGRGVVKLDINHLNL